ncbi:DUF4301 family protein [Pseudofulvibacter geojedonensis]|uniref:DUF4301 family protein n=1 Tax=Pseudofulvibacter geojedonensis TaxID=1123758 RepID=A0ABW3I1M8_9FLAO
MDIEFKIKKLGKDLKKISNQIQYFKKGVEKTKLVKPALIQDGIIRIDESKSANVFNDVENKDIVAFIPASGAATRMFKELFLFLETGIANDTVADFFENINRFLFVNSIPKEKKKSERELLEFVLSSEGLNFGQLPKGLIPFHNKTAFEEQLKHTSLYVNKLHFTISENHLNNFELKLKEVNYQKEVSFSFQKPSTDTIAVDLENNPFEENGELLFRPGGHGALIENLNDIDADIVFIKNIDNVAIEKVETKNIVYKKALGGKLLELQNKVFGYLELLSNPLGPTEVNEIIDFAKQELNIVMPEQISNLNSFLIKKLNRPIRICGMVKNEGQPGGGPFWVCDKNGDVSLQIVEGAQMDKNDPEQLKIMNQATHFNPVDIVCGVKNYKGEKFNLLEFVDEEAVFITQKSRNGKLIKALERPGLWNGAMADWITVFVEVPSHTFNPVKTVNDLLKPNHQNG